MITRVRIITLYDFIGDRPEFRDPALPLTWRQRVFDLRHATGYFIPRFSRLSGISESIVKRIEYGTGDAERNGGRYSPTLNTIRKIRKMEAVFAKELAQYRSNSTFYDRLRSKPYKLKCITYDDGTVQEIRIPGGFRRTRFRPIDLTTRPDDLAALGGMDAYRNRSKATEWEIRRREREEWFKQFSKRTRRAWIEAEWVFPEPCATDTGPSDLTPAPLTGFGGSDGDWTQYEAYPRLELGRSANG